MKKEDKYCAYLKDLHGYCDGVRSINMKHAHFKIKIKKYNERLEAFWIENFPRKSLELFKTLWTTHH